MAVFTWPPSLPQNVRTDFSAVRTMNIISTAMDSGPAKRRRRAAGIEQLKVGFFMSTAQVATLESFIQASIKGTARFDFQHPITGAAVEVRFVPQSDGQLYTATYSSPGQWSVDMTLEVLP